VLGDCTLGQLAERPSMIRQWLAALRLSPLSAGQVFITLSAILAAAAEDGLITRNPCKVASVRPRTPPRRKIVPWTPAQVMAIRAGLPPEWQAIADCGAGLGLRQGEAFALRPGAVDPAPDGARHPAGEAGKRAPVAGRAEGGQGPLRPAPADSLAGAGRAHGRGPAGASDAAVERAGQQEARRAGDRAAAVHQQTGRAINSSSFGHAWTAARDAAGISAGGMHMLRHAYASVLLSGGVDVRALSEYLGHHDPGFTLRVYAHLMPSAEGRALRAVEAAFASAAADGPATARGGANP